MSLPFYLINAFTIPTSPHSGNQAAVVLLPPSHPKAGDDDWKQLVARDFNYAETAFVEKKEDGRYGLRWWTPEVEVVLCGHATLAAATALFTLQPELKEIKFDTRWSGELVARRGTSDPSVTSNAMEVTISLPAFDTKSLNKIQDTQSSEDFSAVKDLLEIAIPQLKGQEAAKNVFSFAWGSESSIIIELNEDVDLTSLKVDTKKMLKISKGLICLTQPNTAESKPGVLTIKTRVFGPGVGVDEDSVTGSAHAYLTAYYLSAPIFSRLPAVAVQGQKPEDLVLAAYQLSTRQGKLDCKLEAGGKVAITGRGVIWGKGDLIA